MLTSLIALALLAPAPRPAFLDGPDLVTVPLQKPATLAEVQGKYRFRIDGVDQPVTGVQMGGEPAKTRVLPRTPGRVILAGTLQSALGGKEWDPDGELTQMSEISPGVFELVVDLPKGDYEYKIARNGSWDENYGVNFERGGSNFRLHVPTNHTVVKFVVDFPGKRIQNSIDNPAEVSAPAAAPPLPKPAGPLKYPVAILTLAKPVAPADVERDLEVVTTDGDQERVFARGFLSQPEFLDDRPLGAFWEPKATTFRVWSPPSRKATLLLFQKATGGVPRRVSMQRSPSGVWSATVPGNLDRRFYQYEFLSYGAIRVCPDIDCFAASPDSKRSMIVDLAKTNPPGWASQPLRHHPSQTDAVIYELSVRDFTASPSSGVKPAFRGKYAGMVQPGTLLPGAHFPTGLDYLKQLGVTDVHLLPVQNFLTGSPADYSWGYATNLFNVPEETYSATPNDPVGVIREFKDMVEGLHNAGIGVVMDVVYNHTWPPEGKDSAFEQTVPYYYFRTNPQGALLNESGVGNALADDRPMVRKYVRDSLVYWLKQYKIDGFRFDLLGMFTLDSVRMWTAAMRAARPDVLIYGEPWTGGGPTRFPKGAQRGMRVAVFNDWFRNTFRGDLDGAAPGFIEGGGADVDALQKAVTGWIDTPGRRDGFADSPQESVNYVSAHDNTTLLDRIAKSLPGRPDLQTSALRLAEASVILSQGVPFWEGGAEIGRTKGGIQNSYNAGDAANAFDWSRAPAFVGSSDYLKGLIALRKAYPVFRLGAAEQVRRAVRFQPSSRTTFAFTLRPLEQGRFKEFLVILNGARDLTPYTLPAGRWQVLVNFDRAAARPFGEAAGNLPLRPLSAYVLAR